MVSNTPRKTLNSITKDKSNLPERFQKVVDAIRQAQADRDPEIEYEIEGQDAIDLWRDCFDYHPQVKATPDIVMDMLGYAIKNIPVPIGRVQDEQTQIVYNCSPDGSEDEVFFAQGAYQSGWVILQTTDWNNIPVIDMD